MQFLTEGFLLITLCIVVTFAILLARKFGQSTMSGKDEQRRKGDKKKGLKLDPGSEKASDVKKPSKSAPNRKGSTSKHLSPSSSVDEHSGASSIDGDSSKQQTKLTSPPQTPAGATGGASSPTEEQLSPPPVKAVNLPVKPKRKIKQKETVAGKLEKNGTKQTESGVSHTENQPQPCQLEESANKIPTAAKELLDNRKETTSPLKSTSKEKAESVKFSTTKDVIGPKATAKPTGSVEKYDGATSPKVDNKTLPTNTAEECVAGSKKSHKKGTKMADPSPVTEKPILTPVSDQTGVKEAGVTCKGDAKLIPGKLGSIGDAEKTKPTVKVDPKLGKTKSKPKTAGIKPEKIGMEPSPSKTSSEVTVSTEQSSPSLNMKGAPQEQSNRQQESRKLTSFSKMGSTNGDGEDMAKTQDGKCAESSKAKLVGSADAGVASQQQPQVRVLTLNQGDHLENTLFRLQKGFVLQLRPGPSLFGKRISIFTNHPNDLNTQFSREKYSLLTWKNDSANKGDDTALYVEVVILLAGSFHFYLTVDDSTDKASAKSSGYFLVDPTLTRGNKKEVLPLDCIQCETFLAKCLGTLDRWPQTLQVAKEAGYNMIHFTPIQELGASRSGYSLKDQLKLNSEFNPPGQQCTIDDVKKIVKMMDDEWKVLSLTDIVLNHTANESEWLIEHSECTYNMVNSPHLRPAYLLDRVIYHLALQIIDGKWKSRGIPKALVQESQVKTLGAIMYDQVLTKPRVEEFFLLDIDSIIIDFHKRLQQKRRPSLKGCLDPGEVCIVQDPLFGRFSCTVDMDKALMKFNISWPDCNQEDRVNRCCEEFRRHLEYLNQKKRNEIAGHLKQAVGCVLGTVRYERLQGNGPKIKEVSIKHPLVPRYFTHFGPNGTPEEEEALSFSSNCCYLMAHNGWVMGDDPLRNFAGPDSDVYLRRELNAWGDSVKLRYGDEPDDCPYLWDHMKRYVEETARVFHGIRLDNCHSTPIHVAEYLLDSARRVRPDLYVIAELFTASDRTDNVFVNRLGINSLIREAMSAPNSHEEGRLVYRYGGEPVGAFLLPPVRPMVPSIAHAIFIDITHDNKSPCETRTAWDMLPSTALVNMACCASGSTRGYDEIVPHHIHVVTEERKYLKWSEKNEPSRGTVNARTGIMACKRILNDLHFELGFKGFNQVFVDQVTEHIVTITRHNPVTHESVVLVAFTSFRPPAHIPADYIRPLKVQGKFEEILFELRVKGKAQGDESAKVPGKYVKDLDYINGVDGFDVEVREKLQPNQSTFVRQVSPPGADTTEFEYTAEFRPGSVIAFKLSLLQPAQKAVNQLRDLLGSFGYTQRIDEINTRNEELLEIVKKISLSSLNRVLFRCDQEENDEGRGWGAYSLTSVGPFVYCGLQGMMSVLSQIRVQNDLGHPLCGNLRDGDWLMDYISGRLKLEPPTQKLGLWLENKFSLLKHIPRYLIPAYFDALITAVYLTLINHAWTSMADFIALGSDFAKALGLSSVQMCGVVKSALLPRLSPNLKPPQPPSESNIQTSVTISAGLPHFSVGYMRNWGRDTFIALPGNLLLTGRYDEARWIILAFAATLRHGLIPNLLDGGAKSRFNCRDSVWFWLYSIQQYVDTVPNGHAILKDTVSRLFPQDDSEPQAAGKYDQPLESVIHETFQRHFQGVRFRERNAGHQIDSQMTNEGFNNEICVNLDNGFPYGGNENNCGTWMDKMGSSEKAGNKGKPATPRDGSAVEIVGLCKASLRFLVRMHSEGKFAFNTVRRKQDDGSEIEWTYEFWERRIADNFEKFFWINTVPTPEREPRPDLINRRGIYKDTVGATRVWGDYQLRCNFPIALAVAPEMVTSVNALQALEKAEEALLGPLGIKTLDPSDWNYRGDYDNSNDSSDPSVAHGCNYHQGPEWVWPVGWFLRAKLAVAAKCGKVDEMRKTMSHIKHLLAPRFTHLLSSPWRSLPELTNSNGSYCRDSNPAQSWSTGCLLEVLWEMNKIELRLEACKL